jgi:hypothetical protein
MSGYGLIADVKVESIYSRPEADVAIARLVHMLRTYYPVTVALKIASEWS